MSKPQCKQKRSFESEVDALYNKVDGCSIYRCPDCGNWHMTTFNSRLNKNRNRFLAYKKRQK